MVAKGRKPLVWALGTPIYSVEKHSNAVEMCS
jgi:hypothetical protein